MKYKEKKVHNVEAPLFGPTVTIDVTIVLSRNCSIAHMVCHRRWTQTVPSTIQTLFEEGEVTKTIIITAYGKEHQAIEREKERKRKNQIRKLSLKSFLASFNG